MQTSRLRIRILPRRPSSPSTATPDTGSGVAPDDRDEQEGRALVSLVRQALERGGGAVAVVVRPDRTELIDLRSVVESRIPVPLFLAGLTRSAPEGQRLPLAVGIAGKFVSRRTGDAPGVPVGVVFLEWADCRWWHWRVVLGADGRPLQEGETVWRAVDGDPLPPGLGRWWSLGRRTGNVVQYGPIDPDDPDRQPASPLVH